MSAKDWNEDPDMIVRRLATIGCTDEEIAVVVGCDPSWISTRFEDALKTGRANRNASLRHQQYKIALRGDVRMLIWLGKQDLGQRDKKELTGGDGTPLFPDKSMYDDRARKIRERMLAELGPLSVDD